MRQKLLASYFTPETYRLLLFDNAPGQAQLIIDGQKLPPPNKRITLHQGGIKVHKALIKRYYRNVVEEHEASRINHLAARQEVRLHVSGKLFPGRYQIKLEFTYRVKPEAYRDLPQLIREGRNLRNFLPCIDEPEAREAADFEVSYTSAKN